MTRPCQVHEQSLSGAWLERPVRCLLWVGGIELPKETPAGEVVLESCEAGFHPCSRVEVSGDVVHLSAGVVVHPLTVLSSLALLSWQRGRRLSTNLRSRGTRFGDRGVRRDP